MEYQRLTQEQLEDSVKNKSVYIGLLDSQSHSDIGELSFHRVTLIGNGLVQLYSFKRGLHHYIETGEFKHPIDDEVFFHFYDDENSKRRVYRIEFFLRSFVYFNGPFNPNILSATALSPEEKI